MCGDKEDVLEETRAWRRGLTRKGVAAKGTDKDNFLIASGRAHQSVETDRRAAGGVHKTTLVGKGALSGAGSLVESFWWLMAL